MKKSILLIVALFSFVIVNAQTIEEIVKKYTVANKLDKIGSISTIKVSGKMSVQGMDLTMDMWMKNPDKMKVVMNVMGQEVISVINGNKGYTTNPMAGSTDPVAMTETQVQQTANQNLFNNYMEGYLKKGALTLLGSENVNDKPAFKIKVVVDANTTMTMFIDQSSYLLVKTNASSAQGTADIIYSDFKDNNGVFLPMKTTTSAMGQEMVMIYNKVEVNIPMDETLFIVK
jgi:hypothetical protein